MKFLFWGIIAVGCNVIGCAKVYDNYFGVIKGNNTYSAVHSKLENISTYLHPCWIKASLTVKNFNREDNILNDSLYDINVNVRIKKDGDDSCRCELDQFMLTDFTIERLNSEDSLNSFGEQDKSILKMESTYYSEDAVYYYLGEHIIPLDCKRVAITYIITLHQENAKVADTVNFNMDKFTGEHRVLPGWFLGS